MRQAIAATLAISSVTPEKNARLNRAALDPLGH
jgi:hypothetical protein